MNRMMIVVGILLGGIVVAQDGRRPAVSDPDLSRFISLCRGGATPAIALGDVDGDTRLDMVFGNGRHEPEPNLLYVNGNRTDLWFPPRPLGNSATYGVALADLNGDRHLDLVEVNDYGFLHMVWLNDGRGNFAAEDFFGRADDARGLAVGDLTGDGFPEIVVANRRDDRGDATNAVYINDGTGHFRERRPLPGRGSFVKVALGDLNGDGRLDIAAAGISESQNYLWLNDGTARFPRAVPFGGPSSRRDSADIAMADIDRDDHSDIVLVNTERPGRIFFGDGKGDFSRSATFGEALDTRVYALARRRHRWRRQSRRRRGIRRQGVHRGRDRRQEP